MSKVATTELLATVRAALAAGEYSIADMRDWSADLCDEVDYLRDRLDKASDFNEAFCNEVGALLHCGDGEDIPAAIKHLCDRLERAEDELAVKRYVDQSYNEVAERVVELQARAEAAEAELKRAEQHIAQLEGKP